MNQTITLPKSVFEELVGRLSRLEYVVFGKNKTSDEYIKLSPAAEKRYKKIEEDFKKNKNIYAFNDSDSALKFLLSDKR